MRPGMYIGKLGDGKDADDGIYVLLKEVIDNSIDEYTMGHGRTVEVAIKDDEVRVRDYGRGIPLGKVVDCVSKINTGGKYDSRAFKKSVGLEWRGHQGGERVEHGIRGGECAGGPNEARRLRARRAHGRRQGGIDHQTQRHAHQIQARPRDFQSLPVSD